MLNLLFSSFYLPYCLFQDNEYLLLVKTDGDFWNVIGKTELETINGDYLNPKELLDFVKSNIAKDLRCDKNFVSFENMIKNLSKIYLNDFLNSDFYKEYQDNYNKYVKE